MLLIYSLTVPLTADVPKFIEFIEKEYFSAVHWGPTRVGQILGLKLLSNREAPDEAADVHSFFLLVDWSGLAMGQIRLDGDAVTETLEKFGGLLTRLGAFDEVANFNNPLLQ